MRKVLIGLILQLAWMSTASAQVTLTQMGGDRSCTNDCKSAAIIFIHGLTGSNSTWVNADTGASFPDLIHRSGIAETVDVFTIEYASMWNSGNSVVKVTKSVAAQIDELMKDKKYRSAIIVAHSLGGNIAREYLAHVKHRYGHAALGRFPMLITLGTPVKGAPHAAFLSLFSNNEQLRSLIEIRKNDFLQLLGDTVSDVFAKRLNNNCTPIEIDAAYETRSVGPVLVVPKDSAIEGATRTAGDGWNKNHLQLPKPASTSDPVYEWVSSEINRCLTRNERCKPTGTPGDLCRLGDF